MLWVCEGEGGHACVELEYKLRIVLFWLGPGIRRAGPFPGLKEDWNLRAGTNFLARAHL